MNESSLRQGLSGAGAFPPVNWVATTLQWGGGFRVLALLSLRVALRRDPRAYSLSLELPKEWKLLGRKCLLTQGSFGLRHISSKPLPGCCSKNLHGDDGDVVMGWGVGKDDKDGRGDLGKDDEDLGWFFLWRKTYNNRPCWAVKQPLLAQSFSHEFIRSWRCQKASHLGKPWTTMNHPNVPRHQEILTWNSSNNIKFCFCLWHGKVAPNREAA